MASRRTSIIDSQIEALARLFGRENAQVLDLGCGPGLYCQRLANQGHQCTGIDFSPASIGYARQQANSFGLDIDYRHGDIRTTDFPQDQDIILFLFGEFNVFQPEDAATIAKKAKEALKPGGLFVIEPSTYDSIRAQGHGRSFWRAMSLGLFGDKPHIWMYEALWDDSSKTATDRHFILEEGANDIVEYASSAQAYTEYEYKALLKTAGFDQIRITNWQELGVDYDSPQFHVILAENKV